MKSLITSIFIFVLLRSTFAFDADSLDRAFEKYPPGATDLPGLRSSPGAIERLRTLEFNESRVTPKEFQSLIEWDSPEFYGSARFSPEPEKDLSISLSETLWNEIGRLNADNRRLQHEIDSLRSMILELEYALRERHNSPDEWETDP